MIGYLRGKPLRSTPDAVLLDVGGVGYEVHVTLTTFSEIEHAGSDGPIELHVHTHVREDAIVLFGFWTEAERHLFEKLISISGIGPRLARNILSGSSTADLLAALADGDLVRLSKLPGVGKKTAERMVLELKDKLTDLAAEVPAAAPRRPAADEDLVSALVNLGYKQGHAEKAVEAARADAPEASFHELLRLSLRRLSRA